MTRHTFWRFVWCFSCVVLSGWSARGAEDVLTVVPHDVLGVVVVNRLAETSGKVAELTKKMQLPAPDLLTLLKASTGMQAGLDEKRSLAVAAVTAGGAPAPVWFVPVTDFAAFLKQFQPADPQARIASAVIANNKSVVARKGSFAVVAEELHRANLEAVLNASRTLAAEAKALDGWCGGNDSYAIGTPAGILMFQQQVLAGMALAKTQLEGADEKMRKQALMGLAMYEGLLAALPKEVAYAAVGVRIEPDGTLHIASRTLPVPGGVLAGLAQAGATAADQPLAGLSAGSFVVAGGGVLPRGWAKPLMEFSWNAMKMYPGGESLTEEQSKQFTELMLQSMQGLQSMALRMGAGKPGEPLYGDVMFAMRTDDAARYLAGYERAMRRMAEMGKATKNPLLAYEVENLQIDGQPALKMTMDLKAYMQGQEIPQVKQMFEMMFGPGAKLPVYLAAADRQTVVGVYISQDRLRDALKAARAGTAGLAADPGVMRTAAQLPAGAQWVGYWNLRGTQQFVARMIASLLPDAPIKLPEFPETQPVGFAAKLTASGLDTDMVVPAEVLTAGAKFVRDVMAGH
jgi:hypothetical protein